MLECLVVFFLCYKVLVLIVFVVIGFFGFQVVCQLFIDVFFDVILVQVNVYIEVLGLVVEDVEQLFIMLVELVLVGLFKVEQICLVSLFGLFYVLVYFDDSMDIYFVCQLVNEWL